MPFRNSGKQGTFHFPRQRQTGEQAQTTLVLILVLPFPHWEPPALCLPHKEVKCASGKAALTSLCTLRACSSGSLKEWLHQSTVMIKVAYSRPSGSLKEWLHQTAAMMKCLNHIQQALGINRKLVLGPTPPFFQ